MQILHNGQELVIIKKNVKITNIQDIGKKKIKDKHKFYLGKFLD